ncbi:hypothetical protein D3C73_185650 [compost metagenome]
MTETTKYIFGEPDFTESVGHIYPVKLKDYDQFQEASSVLYYNKHHFGDEFQEFLLLDLIVLGLREQKFIDDLQTIFTIVTQKEVEFKYDETNQSYGFILDNTYLINGLNYDEIRQIIMKQNIMFEQKVYKDKRVQAWAEKTMKARSKNGIKMDLEDIISTVSVITGKNYSDLREYTIYQLQSDFNRINKIKSYDTTVSFMCAGDTKSSLTHYAEKVDLFKNPYDDIFVSKDKLSNLNKAFS